MREIRVTKKTGFKIKDPTKTLIIRDFRGVLFYSTESVLPNVECFNLPGFNTKLDKLLMGSDAGKFYIETGGIVELDSPLSWKVPKLPGIEASNESPIDFEIKFGVNKHKATIMFDEKVILLDNQFLEVALPKLYYILFHEFAHQYYFTEAYTDLLAANYMLVKGFNPEQIGSAEIHTLSDKQYNRKRVLVNHLMNLHYECE